MKARVGIYAGYIIGSIGDIATSTDISITANRLLAVLIFVVVIWELIEYLRVRFSWKGKWLGQWISIELQSRKVSIVTINARIFGSFQLKGEVLNEKGEVVESWESNKFFSNENNSLDYSYKGTSSFHDTRKRFIGYCKMLGIISGSKNIESGYGIFIESEITKTPDLEETINNDRKLFTFDAVETRILRLNLKVLQRLDISAFPSTWGNPKFRNKDLVKRLQKIDIKEIS